MAIIKTVPMSAVIWNAWNKTSDPEHSINDIFIERTEVTGTPYPILGVIQELVKYIGESRSLLILKKFSATSIKNSFYFECLDEEMKKTVLVACGIFQSSPLSVLFVRQFYRNCVSYISSSRAEGKELLLEAIAEVKQVTGREGVTKSQIEEIILAARAKLMVLDIKPFSQLAIIIDEIILSLFRLKATFLRFAAVEEQQLCKRLSQAKICEEKIFLSFPPQEAQVSARFLMERLRQRVWKLEQNVARCSCTDEEKREDKEIFSQILTMYNERFREKRELIERAQKPIGIFEKILVPEGSKVFVRADLHGALGELFSQIDLLQELGFLDREFHFAQGFHAIFLGDYMDRGPYGVECLSLLLLLLIQNPRNMHLIRGNHEDPSVNLRYIDDTVWFDSHRKSLLACYRSFPVVITIAEQQGRKSRNFSKDFMHFSHGLVSFQVDIIPFLEGSDMCVALEETKTPSERILNLRTRKGSSLKKKIVRAAEEILKLREKEIEILGQQEFSLGSPVSQISYLWSDIDDMKDAVLKSSTRKVGLSVPVKALRTYSRVRGDAASIRGFVRGHKHEYAEHVCGIRKFSKVIATTLPMAELNLYGHSQGLACPRALIYTVGSSVKKWKKQGVFLTPENRSILNAREVGALDPIPKI